jgi:hypothetical protein
LEFPQESLAAEGVSRLSPSCLPYAQPGTPPHTSADLQRVTFRFSVNTEVHYVVALPEPGDFVDHRHELWVVTQLGEDSAGAFAICKRSPLEPSVEGSGGAD